MANQKTKPVETSVTDFIDSITDEQKRKDSYSILALMKDITGEEPKIWGKNMIGFGEYHYKYASGHEGNWFKVGFSPRKNEFSIYIMSGFSNYENLMQNLGKHKTGKSCLYVKKLSDIDRVVFKVLIEESVKYVEKTYG